jgi:hypothetical protein
MLFFHFSHWLFEERKAYSDVPAWHSPPVKVVSHPAIEPFTPGFWFPGLVGSYFFKLFSRKVGPRLATRHY